MTLISIDSPLGKNNKVVEELIIFPESLGSPLLDV